MAGYQLLSDDLTNIPPEYMCKHCGYLVRDAMQTPCWHFYCRACLEHLKSSDEVYKCKVDGEQFKRSEVFPDRLVRKEIQDFEVHCRYNESGCDWNGKIANLELHHERECPAYPVECEKCNKHGIPRAKLFEHQDPVVGDCNGVLGPCPFSQIGCPQTEVFSHRQRRERREQANRGVEALLIHDPRMMSTSPNMFSHYDAILSAILDGKVENRYLRGKCREHSERITSLERRLASRNFPAATQSAQVAQGSVDSNGGLQNTEIMRRLINLENRTTDHEATIRRQVDTFLETVRRLERRFDCIEHTLALRNVTLADLEEYIRQQEFSSFNGQLLWKIQNFSRLRNQAVSGQQECLYSPHFSTSRYGYDLRACIYLNGDGMGRGTHISVFFVVMHGQYDALLRWPFRQEVTFMLMDQDNVEHVINAFRPDPSSSSFQRPRRETNIASGCTMFFPLEELNNHAYVRDDTMFIKVIVDTSDL